MTFSLVFNVGRLGLLLSFLIGLFTLFTCPAAAQEPTSPEARPPATHSDTADVKAKANTPPASAEVSTRLKAALGFDQSDLPERKGTFSTLQEILAQPQFQNEDFTDAGPSPFERFLDWLQKLLNSAGLPGGSVAVVVLTAVLLLAVLYLIFRLVWELIQRRAARATTRLEARVEDMSATALLAAAEQSARDGDYRSAIRWRFLALVKQLELPSATVLTNSQLTRLVRKAQHAAAAPFAAAAAGFEDAWYGGFACGRDEYVQLGGLAAQVVNVWSTADEASS